MLRQGTHREPILLQGREQTGFIPITGKHDERSPVRAENVRQSRGEPLNDIRTPPPGVTLITRLAPEERRVEGYQIELLPVDRCKQVSLQDTDRVLCIVDQHVGAGATNCNRADVHSYHAIPAASREERGDTRSSTHVEC